MEKDRKKFIKKKREKFKYDVESEKRMESL